MIVGHGGNIHDIAHCLGCSPADITDMSSNMNPLGPPDSLLSHLKARLDAITTLPQADAGRCISLFADRHGLDPKGVLAGNGSTQFIYMLPKALQAQKVLIVAPTYSDYADGCQMHGIPFHFFFTQDSDHFRPDMKRLADRIPEFDTVFFCNPNNPTGVLVDRNTLLELCGRFPQTVFIIDESYMPFVPAEHAFTMAGCAMANVIVLNSMSKIFRIPGLRIGFLIAAQGTIEHFHRYMMPWRVNSLAQEATCYLMTHGTEMDAFIDTSRQYVALEQKKMAAGFSDTERIKVFSSFTSFMLARLSLPLTAEEVCAKMLKDRILLRNCSNFKGLSNQYIRISLKTADINRHLAEGLTRILDAV